MPVRMTVMIEIMLSFQWDDIVLSMHTYIPFIYVYMYVNMIIYVYMDICIYVYTYIYNHDIIPPPKKGV